MALLVVMAVVVVVGGEGCSSVWEGCDGVGGDGGVGGGDCDGGWLARAEVMWVVRARGCVKSEGCAGIWDDDLVRVLNVMVGLMKAVVLGEMVVVWYRNSIKDVHV